VLENCFYTADTLAQMCTGERMKIAGYAVVWFIVALNRTTDLATIGVAAQILFSEQIVSRLAADRMAPERVRKHI